MLDQNRETCLCPGTSGLGQGDKRNELNFQTQGRRDLPGDRRGLARWPWERLICSLDLGQEGFSEGKPSAHIGFGHGPLI